MVVRSPAARLTDMIEAIDLIRAEMAGVSLEAFQTGPARSVFHACSSSPPQIDLLSNP
jgi:hypothetical protein